jgi:hypothetical protein
MSIITTAPAVPSRMFSLYASLLGNVAGEVKDRFESWATPPSLRVRGANAGDEGESSTALFSSTLREARNMRILEEIDDKIKVTDEARGLDAKKDPEQRFKSHLVRTLFDPLRAEEAQQDAFVVALAWFLRRNPLQPMGFGDPPQNEVNKDLVDGAVRTELTSLNRFQNFIYWARYLGFATLTGARDARWVLPDPMPAIASVLPEVFGSTSELNVDAFFSRLANIYPVFESGAVRQQIEQFAEVPVDFARDRRVSITTSIALQRLESNRKLEIISRADAAIAILDLGTSERRVSHFALKGA